MNTKTQRVRCSDEDFLKAIYSSKSYLEISQKTGQKIASTIAKYSRLKKSMEKKGEQLPLMKRSRCSKPVKNLNKIKSLASKLQLKT